MTDPLTIGTVAVTGVPIAALGVRRARTAIEARRLRAFRLSFPYGTDPAQVVAFCRSVSGLLPPWWKRLFSSPSLVLEIRADHEGVAHHLLAPAEIAGFLLAQLRAVLPGVRIEVEDDVPTPEVAVAVELRLSNFRWPLRSDDPVSIAAGLISTTQPLRAGERIVIQWVLSPAPTPRRAPFAPTLLAELGLPSARVQAALPLGEAAARREKTSEPGLWAVCRIGAQASGRERARQLIRQVEGAFHPTSAPGASLRRRWLPEAIAARRLRHRAVPLVGWPMLLNAKELAAVSGLPMGDVTLAGVELAGTRQLPPAPSVPRRGRVVGRASSPGNERSVALSVAESLKHLHVIGPTGVGKSTLLLNLICGDMAAGRGVVVIDPKGDLANDVLDRLPKRRIRDLVLLDPNDAARPVGFNVLAQAGATPEMAADQVVAIFRQLYSAFWGPRTDDILRAALLTLLQKPGMTLAEVPLLLTDEGFRRRLIGTLDDYVLEGFWSWYEALSPGERAQATGPVLNKLRTFLLRRRVRNVIGQSESTFSLGSVLTDRKILIVNLAKGRLGEDAAALLGATVLSALWQAVQARAALPAGERAPFFAFIDEFQDYLRLPTNLADVLAQARSYGFGLTLSHQHLGQLPAEIRHAVLANARSKLVFQAAADDARVLAREFQPYLTPADLQGLGAYEAVFAASAGARVAPPATIVTKPPPPPTNCAATARALSRQRYGRDAAKVEAELRGRVEPRAAGAVIGSRRRS